MPSSDKLQAGTTTKWLSLVGIGEDGIGGLPERNRALISDAAFVYGGRRHLALAAPLIRGEVRPWPSPLASAMDEIGSLRGKAVCVLASGDPFHNGVGHLLSRHIPIAEIETLPAVSCFSLAANRLGWPLEEIATISLHGRPLQRLRPLLHPGRRILALTSDSDGPSQVAKLLERWGFGLSRMDILEALGGPEERHISAAAAGVGLHRFHPLNIVAIEVGAAGQPAIVNFSPGLADEMFEHDGQITKREVRALTISALAPRFGEMLWDIGAGSGSISIEWMLSDPSLRAVAIERDEVRARRALQNACELGVPGLQTVIGSAPAALDGLERPDAIFIGGGAQTDGLLDAAMGALSGGGRLVVNAVTLETEAILVGHHVRHGGSLLRIQLSRAAPIASKTAWRSAMPITQWSWRKP